VHIMSLFEGYIDDAVTSIGLFDQGICTTATLYDLIPLASPEEYLSADPIYEQHYLRKIDHLRRASLLLSIAESSRREGIERLGLTADSIVNVPLAADDQFRPISISEEQAQELKNRLGITRPFVFYAGAADERKNLPCLIRAYAQLPDDLQRAHQLVLAGKIPEGTISRLKSVARAAGLHADDLILAGYICDQDLLLLYNLCKLFVLPSRHEGFGLPALEAMSCGRAVIGSNVSGIPEVIGNAEALFDPSSESAIAEKMAQALEDDSFREQLERHGLEQSQRFSWDESARTAIGYFERIHEHRAIKGIANVRGEYSYRQGNYRRIIHLLACLPESTLAADEDLIKCARCIAQNMDQVERAIPGYELPEYITWRIEGPFDSSYSLAILNRETARALEGLGHSVALHSTEGPGDFLPNKEFLEANPDLRRMYLRSKRIPPEKADVVSRNLYPPRVADMRCQINLLHHYAWEESGFPSEWVKEFNSYLSGITCLSNHVEKMMIDHGVVVPLAVSGCGIDHWERINPDPKFDSDGREFRFLHVSSCFPRKGVPILLEAYGRAFSLSDDVSLIIKTFPNPHNEVHRWLEDAKRRKSDYPDVIIDDRVLSDSQIKALYEQCDVFVAPSLAEGFGLPMAEAMMSKLAVITTAWGGQVDFCNEQTAWMIDYTFEYAHTHFRLFDSVWAVPDVGQLARTMREVYEMPKSLRIQRSIKGRESLLREFRWSDAAARLANSARSWARAQEPPQPKIGWISTWNTRCGIAEYSRHLVDSIPSDVIIFAAHTELLMEADGPNVVRCWVQGDNDNLARLADEIDARDIDTVVLQFNYGFFHFGHLSEFLNRQLDAGRIVIVTMHSTCDPVHAPQKRLSQLVDVLARCQRILVHSVHDMNRLKSQGITHNVTLFPHGILDYASRSEDTEMQLATDGFTIGSYGFFLPHKGLLELIKALHFLRTEGMDVRLIMANAEYPIPESSSLIRQAKLEISRLGLNRYVDLNTDFLSDEESLRHLAKADLIVFPYQDSSESSSAAVRFGLATGKPVAVTPLAIFDDVSAAVYTLPGLGSEEIAEGIAELIVELRNETERVQAKKREAKRWREAHYYSHLGQRFFNMIVALNRKKEYVAASNREKALHELRYLEEVIDYENRRERGPVSGKEVVIYSPGKTGTTSLYFSIYNYLKDRREWQDPKDFMLHSHYNYLLIENLKLPNGLSVNELADRYVIRDLIKYKELKGEHIILISSYREPLSRAISDTFHTLEDSVNKHQKTNPDDLSFELCYERFQEALSFILDQDHHSIEEVEEGFFDRYSFDHLTKSCYVKRPHLEILLLCLEHSSHWQAAFEKHLGYHGIEIITANVGSERKLSGLRREFEENLRLPRDLIWEIYFGDHAQQKALRWFYTEEEIGEFYQEALTRYAR